MRDVLSVNPSASLADVVGALNDAIDGARESAELLLFGSEGKSATHALIQIIAVLGEALDKRVGPGTDAATKAEGQTPEPG